VTPRDFPDWDTAKKISMSERVGKEEETLRETACVHVEERELIGFCKAYPLIVPEDEKFNKFLKEVAIPVLTIIGRSRWYRDQITDLGLALSLSEKPTQKSDTKNILKAKVKKRVK